MAADMRGDVGIVSGGGGGIGREVCLQLAKRGVRIAVLDISLANAQKVADEIARRGSEALAVKVDIASAAEVKQAVEMVVRKFKKVGILINCAGVYEISTIYDTTERDWDQMFGVNLKGPFFLCKEVVPLMKEEGSGAIVNVSSISGRTTSLLAGPHYVASKAGVIGLTMVLASQLAADGIRVNCVAPGTTQTPMLQSVPPEGYERLKKRVPLGRLGKAEELAAAIVFLASPAASYITGETLNVNGGAFMM